MTVSAPPEAPRPLVVEEPLVDVQEALIEEARRRARRRRLRYAASALAVGAIALVVLIGHERRIAGVHFQRANGVLAIEVRHGGV